MTNPLNVPRVNVLGVKLWTRVIMVCQCWFTSVTNVSILVRAFDSGGSCAYMEAGGIRQLPLYFTQSYCEYKVYFESSQILSLFLNSWRCITAFLMMPKRSWKALSSSLSPSATPFPLAPFSCPSLSRLVSCRLERDTCHVHRAPPTPTHLINVYSL